MDPGENKIRMADARGFSMVQVIAALLVLGVIAVVVATRQDISAIDVYREAEVIRAHVRYVQAVAMGHNTASWGVSFAGQSYTLLKDGSPSALQFPNEATSTRTLPRGLSFTSGAGTVVTFDEWGTPGSSDVAVILSGLETIRIRGNTGFVQ